MTREEVLKTALEYFKGNELQANVWVDKYCLQDQTGSFLEKTPDDMFHRLAKEFARIEQKYENPMSEEVIYNLLKDFKFVIPGGSILYGVGNNTTFTSLGNCFVIGDSTDSYGSICKIDEEQVQLMKRRGGVGHDLSHLRPAGSLVNNAALSSTGAVSFMNRYSNSTREVAQGGRRGALMLTMDVSHPDIEAFIESKKDITKLTGCNISVKVTDNFMHAVKDDADVVLTFYPNGKEFVEGKEFKTPYLKHIKARQIWDKLVHQAWATGEPGVLFWDRILSESPADKYKEFKSISTNPCGEIPLCPYDTCRLMSVNLFNFVVNPFTKDAYFDAPKFVGVVAQAQRLMDDVINLEEEKIDRILKKIGTEVNPIQYVEFDLWSKIRRKLIRGRRTGLSAIGLADCLAALNVKYGSGDSIDQVNSIFHLFKNSAYYASEEMAKERGAFPAWSADTDARPKPRRNIALLTIPPSGSLAILAGITSGIEPVYRLEYTRRRKVEQSDNVVFVDKNGDKWEEYKVYHPKYEEYGKPSSYEGCTAFDINPLDRVKLQATIQKWIDHSISSTINLPTTATEDEVRAIYMLAWESGCKGITIYREGCREGVLIDNSKLKVQFEQHHAPKRPKKLEGDVKYAVSGGKKYCILVGKFDGKPYEIFALDDTNVHTTCSKYAIVKVESGKYVLLSDDNEVLFNITEKLTDEQAAITRLVSTSLRHGADIKFIVEQLSKTQGDLTSFAKAIARVLKQYVADGTEMKGVKCDVCGNGMIMENGCVTCKSCGQSKCS